MTRKTEKEIAAIERAMLAQADAPPACFKCGAEMQPTAHELGRYWRFDCPTCGTILENRAIR